MLGRHFNFQIRGTVGIRVAKTSDFGFKYNFECHWATNF